MFFCRCCRTASDSRPSVKRWPWTKSLQVHCLENVLKLHTQEECTHVRRCQIPQDNGVAKNTHSENGHTKGSNHQNSFSDALLVDPLTQHLPLSLSPDFVTLGMPTFLPAPDINPIWWEPTRWLHPAGQGLTPSSACDPTLLNETWGEVVWADF